MGRLATELLSSRGSPTLQSGGQNQQYPTKGRLGYITPAISGGGGGGLHSGTISEVAHKWADWLHNPANWGVPNASQWGQNQKCPASVQIGYITHASFGVPNASKRETKSKVPHKRAQGLHQPCHLGAPQRFGAGNKNSSAPQMGRLAT